MRAVKTNIRIRTSSMATVAHPNPHAARVRSTVLPAKLSYAHALIAIMITGSSLLLHIAIQRVLSHSPLAKWVKRSVLTVKPQNELAPAALTPPTKMWAIIERLYAKISSYVARVKRSVLTVKPQNELAPAALTRPTKMWAVFERLYAKISPCVARVKRSVLIPKLSDEHAPIALKTRIETLPTTS
jgi:hypothetical protein